MENNYKIDFGKRLKKERKLRKLTQEQMAEKGYREAGKGEGDALRNERGRCAQ